MLYSTIAMAVVILVLLAAALRGDKADKKMIKGKWKSIAYVAVAFALVKFVLRDNVIIMFFVAAAVTALCVAAILASILPPKKWRRWEAMKLYRKFAWDKKFHSVAAVRWSRRIAFGVVVLLAIISLPFGQGGGAGDRAAIKLPPAASASTSPSPSMTVRGGPKPSEVPTTPAPTTTSTTPAVAKGGSSCKGVPTIPVFDREPLELKRFKIEVCQDGDWKKWNKSGTVVLVGCSNTLPYYYVRVVDTDGKTYVLRSMTMTDLPKGC